ncbi:hypothetical protein TWF718_008544 [Orbilia javanica]|uniref:Uncharacterized protein n=1 Tax=Orbilia javanica TaxID=47235 RepID=A0AAN8MS05_9PEZI
MARDSDMHLPHGLTLVREATNIDNYYYMLTLTGSQAPVVVAAGYSTRDSSKTLSREHVIRAIERVVVKQPTLGHVFVRQPSEEGKDQLWVARLPSLNVEDCVSFIQNNERDPAEASRSMLENIMGQWFNLLDTSKPYWRVTVVNMKTIYFSFNHIVCDGRSGMFFHRSLLTALNDIESERDVPPPLQFITCADVFPDHFQETIAKHTAFDQLWFTIKYFLAVFVGYFFWPEYITYNDMKKYPLKADIQRMAQPEERIKNKIVALRINSEAMQKVLADCRQQSTTFTAFLDTALNASVCADIYPQALMVRACLVADLRSFCEWPFDEVMCNMGASWTKLRLAGPFSAIGRPPRGSSSEEEIYTNIPAFWAMAKYRKEYMNQNLGTGSIQQYLGFSAYTPPRIDDFTAYLWANEGESLAASRNYGSMLSNLVSLVPKEEDKERNWMFTDTDWASSTHRSCVGPSLNITAISAPGADCVVNFIYQEGSYDPEVIPRIVEVVKVRIGQVIGNNGEGLTMRM